MNGASFLAKIADINPRSKRFLLTGHADIEATVAAVNEGKIVHYFAKPWDSVELIEELKNSYEMYLSELKTKKLLKQNVEKNAELSLINSSLELEISKNQQKLELISLSESKTFSRLKKTFSNFIEIIAQAASLHTQDQTKHNFRVAAHSRIIAEQLNCDKLTTFQIYILGLVYETGKLNLEQSILAKPIELLTTQERNQYDSFYQYGADTLSKVDELANVANMLKHIPENYNGTGTPEHLVGEDIPLGSRIVAIASAFDNYIIGRQTQAPISVIEADKRLRELSGKLFDKKIVNLYLKLLEEKPKPSEGEIEYPTNVSQIQEGQILSKDIVNREGHILLTAGTTFEAQHIEKLLEIQNEHDEFFIVFVR